MAIIQNKGEKIPEEASGSPQPPLADTPMASIWSSYVASFSCYCFHKLECSLHLNVCPLTACWVSGQKLNLYWNMSCKVEPYIIKCQIFTDLMVLAFIKLINKKHYIFFLTTIFTSNIIFIPLHAQNKDSPVQQALKPNHFSHMKN